MNSSKALLPSLAILRSRFTASIEAEPSARRNIDSPRRNRAASVISLALGCISLLGCQGQSPLGSYGQESIRGLVIDTLTNKPVPGATIYLDQTPPPPPGALHNPPRDEHGKKTRSSGAGRFSFAGVDPGVHYLYVSKPGYTSSTDDLPDYSSYEFRMPAGSNMGELHLSLTPAAEVIGQIQSDGGQPVPGMQLTLYRKLIQDGRGVWEKRARQLSDARGFYSFSGLKTGTYVVVSSWLVDNDPGPPAGPGCSSYNLDPRSGYAPEASPGVTDFSAAQPIVLKPGQRAVAGLKLQHQVFHAVSLRPNQAARHGFMGMTDRNGRELKREPLPGGHCGWGLPWKLDRSTGLRTINLPDGTYTMAIHDGRAIDQGPGKPVKVLLADFVTFTVAGSSLTVPDTPEHHVSQPSAGIHVVYPAGDPCSGARTSSTTQCSVSDPSENRPTIWLSRADPLPEKATPISEGSRFANSTEFTGLAPGRYWVHTTLYQYTRTYVASITAGNVDLSRQPLVVGLDMTSPSLQVKLRNDFGALHVKYTPANPAAPDAGGLVRDFSALLVPQFSGWVDTQSFLFEDGTPKESTIGNLPPGHYKMYVMPRHRDVEFRNPADTAADLGPGQDVWIKARGKAEVTVTEPPLE